MLGAATRLTALAVGGVYNCTIFREDLLQAIRSVPMPRLKRADVKLHEDDVDAVSFLLCGQIVQNLCQRGIKIQLSRWPTCVHTTGQR